MSISEIALIVIMVISFNIDHVEGIFQMDFSDGFVFIVRILGFIALAELGVFLIF